MSSSVIFGFSLLFVFLILAALYESWSLPFSVLLSTPVAVFGESVRDLQQSVDVSLMRYRGGTANYLEVLDSQRSLFEAELTLAQDRNNEYQGLVQLYKALGGGWK